MTSTILGTGSSLPSNIVTNTQLSQIVNTNDEWIRDRTGIHERRIAVTENTTTLSIDAAKKALEASGILPIDLDLIIVATLTPNGSMPSTACKVQAAIGATKSMCYDINAACTGFIYGIQTAHAFITSGMIKYALIIGAETLSKIIDWTDRSTCVLFGDGAGAAVIGSSEKGIISVSHGSHGLKGNVLTCGNRPLINPFTKSQPDNQYVEMNGQEVFKFATRKIPSILEELSQNSGIPLQKVNCFLLHQANERIIQTAAKRLKLDETLFPINLHRYGNTSAASIAILLDECIRNNTIKKGNIIVLAGFGGGLTWGGILMEI